MKNYYRDGLAYCVEAKLSRNATQVDLPKTFLIIFLRNLTTKKRGQNFCINILMMIELPVFVRATFNFFKNDDCTDFKFSRTLPMTIDQIHLLLDSTPEERLEEFKPILKRYRFGKSCEFYFQGDFYPCGNVSDKDKSRVENMLKARKAKEKIIVQLASEMKGNSLS